MLQSNASIETLVLGEGGNSLSSLHWQSITPLTVYQFIAVFIFQITPGMRALLVDWLTKVQKQFQFCITTLFSAVNIIDRFLLTTPISRDCFQLLGITALLVAGKLVSSSLKLVCLLC